VPGSDQITRFVAPSLFSSLTSLVANIYSIHRLTSTNLRQLLSRLISDSVDKATHLGDNDSSHNSELSSERYMQCTKPLRGLVYIFPIALIPSDDVVFNVVSLLIDRAGAIYVSSPIRLAMAAATRADVTPAVSSLEDTDICHPGLSLLLHDTACPFSIRAGSR